MSMNEALVILQSWFTVPEERLVEALSVVIRLKSSTWIDRHPDLFTHPRDTVDEESLGHHQCWHWHIMPYREVPFLGRTLYIFEYHIEDLMS